MEEKTAPDCELEGCVTRDVEPKAPGDVLSLDIDRSNHAFAEDPVLQTNLCLAQVAMALIEDSESSDPTRTSGTIRDANGNTVGQWTLTPVDELPLKG